MIVELVQLVGNPIAIVGDASPNLSVTINLKHNRARIGEGCRSKSRIECAVSAETTERQLRPHDKFILMLKQRGDFRIEFNPSERGIGGAR